MADFHFKPEKPESSGENKESTTSRVSDLYLERFHLGELDASETEELQKRLQTDEDLRRRLDRMLEHERSFATSHPPTKWVPRIEKAAQTKRSVRQAGSEGNKGFWDFLDSLRSGNPWAVGAVALATLMLTAVPIWFTGADSEVESVRLKGDAQSKAAGIILYRQALDSAVVLQPGDGVSAGDAVQVEIQPGGFPFAAVFSVDGKGEVTWHWPSETGKSTRLPQANDFRLPNAFLLDNAPGFERFCAVFSKDSLALQSLQGMDSVIRESRKHAPEWLGQQMDKAFWTKGIELRKAP